MAGLSAENPLKEAFRPNVIEAWARRLAVLDTHFDAEGFLETIFERWNELSFGARSSRIADALDQHLTRGFPFSAELLVRALDEPLGPEDLAAIDRFYVMPQCAWVARRGRAEGDFETTANTLREMTRRFSAEGDLRVLFEIDQTRALSLLEAWTTDPDPHVRRLVSEGTRPRLPLASRWRRFDTEPGPILGLLERLKEDGSLYVRRSVANNLNDWAKDHPDRIASLLAHWSSEASEARRWLVDHASRTLVKRGHPTALALHGVDVNQPWEVSELTVDPDSCRRGGSLVFSYRLTHHGTVPAVAVADFFFGPSPGSARAKVFKGRRVRSVGGHHVIEGQRSLADTSGRTWRPGPHRLAIQVNGRILAETRVNLI